jgi:hypothetical protein
MWHNLLVEFNTNPLQCVCIRYGSQFFVAKTAVKITPAFIPKVFAMMIQNILSKLVETISYMYI